MLRVDTAVGRGADHRRKLGGILKDRLSAPGINPLRIASGNPSTTRPFSTG